LSIQAEATCLKDQSAKLPSYRFSIQRLSPGSRTDSQGKALTVGIIRVISAISLKDIFIYVAARKI